MRLLPAGCPCQLSSVAPASMRSGVHCCGRVVAPCTLSAACWVPCTKCHVQVLWVVCCAGAQMVLFQPGQRLCCSTCTASVARRKGEAGMAALTITPAPPMQPRPHTAPTAGSAAASAASTSTGSGGGGGVGGGPGGMYMPPLGLPRGVARPPLSVPAPGPHILGGTGSTASAFVATGAGAVAGTGSGAGATHGVAVQVASSGALGVGVAGDNGAAQGLPPAASAAPNAPVPPQGPGADAGAPRTVAPLMQQAHAQVVALGMARRPPVVGAMGGVVPGIPGVAVAGAGPSSVGGPSAQALAPALASASASAAGRPSLSGEWKGLGATKERPIEEVAGSPCLHPMPAPPPPHTHTPPHPILPVYAALTSLACPCAVLPRRTLALVALTGACLTLCTSRRADRHTHPSLWLRCLLWLPLNCFRPSVRAFWTNSWYVTGFIDSTFGGHADA